MLRSNYSFNESVRFTFEYRYQRSGENIYAEDGTLLKNVGGDIALSHGYLLQTDRAYFLDGDRVNTNFFSAWFRIEPVRDFIFDVSFIIWINKISPRKYLIKNHIYFSNSYLSIRLFK